MSYEDLKKLRAEHPWKEASMKNKGLGKRSQKRKNVAPEADVPESRRRRG